ncbi:hypothetical protein, partial [Pseudomonas asplenii]|uniref:hypothetical protein n=1 Tax=Pseudomonas asplenii TaxID=53407 RepID=UPI00056B4671
RQQATDNAQGRSLLLADATQGKAQFEQVTRQGTDTNVSGSTVNVTAPLSNPADSIAPVPGAGANRVVGLPDTSGRSSPHKYLIETNPVLTDLKQFMSSDYL